MSRCLLAALLAASVTSCTERNPDICCETEAECARVSLTEQVSCSSGTCVRNLCAASGCDGPEDCGGAACSAGGQCEPGVDAPGPDAATNRPCTWDAPFGEPVPLGGLDAAGLFESGAHLTSNELTVYLAASVDYQGENQIYVAHRASLDQSFPSPALLAGVNTAQAEFDPTPDATETTLYFTAVRASGLQRIFASVRSSKMFDFGAGQQLANVNTTQAGERDAGPFLSSDGNELWFSSTRTPTSGLFDIWRSVREGGVFGQASRVAELASAGQDTSPVLSRDRLTIYFASNRPGGKGLHDIYRARRATPSAMFGAPTLVPELNSARDEDPNYLSDDNCRMYLLVDTGTTTNIAVATRAPPR